MSTEKKPATVRDLVEEAKKRIVFLIICVVGLSYLMSLTSSSVLINLPAAAVLIIILRYLSLDFDMRRKAAAYNSKPSLANIYSQRKHEGSKLFIKRSDWRRKVNSPVVEDAIDQFTRHIVSEWVTDLWYSRITPDRQGPEELVHIINGVLAEISRRMRNINLIDLLTRDIIKLFCSHLELFRASHLKIQKRQLGSLTIGQRDVELKYVLAAQNKLHPGLYSAEAEHKVLQHVMDGLISFTFKPEDLQCSLFRYIIRELLSCAVMRPVLNLANPRFINERIESLAMSLKKADKGATIAQVVSQSKSNESSKVSSVQISRSLDPSVKGVELMQVKKDQSNSFTGNNEAEKVNGKLLSKDPLLSIGTQSTRSWSSLPLDSQTGDQKCIQRHNSGGEWGDMLDTFSRRKTEALAPENFENMWTKGKNYKKREGADRSALPVQHSTSVDLPKEVDHSKSLSMHREKADADKVNAARNPAFLSVGTESLVGDKLFHHNDRSKSGHPPVASFEKNNEDSLHLDNTESESSSSFPTEDEESSNVTGLDSPGIKVWDGKNNRNHSVSHIHHPLEMSKGHKTRKTGKGRIQSQRLLRAHSGRKKSKSSSQNVDVWQEVERTSFLLGDGQDILNSSKGNVKSDSSGDSEVEFLGIPRIDKLEIEGRGFHTNLYAVRGIYSGGKEGKSRIQWLRSMVGSPDLISIPGETGRMYEANVDDVGYRLVAVYTPVREDGVEGQPISALTESIAVEPDVLKEVKQKLDGVSSVKFEPGTFLDQKEKLIKYSDFVNKELILFSMADLQRSIPSMVDGLNQTKKRFFSVLSKRSLPRKPKLLGYLALLLGSSLILWIV